MSNYAVQLVPALVNFATESGLDTSVVGGVSLQRTLNMVMTVDSSDNRKMVVEVKDDGTFSDVPQTLVSVPGIIAG